MNISLSPTINKNVLENNFKICLLEGEYETDGEKIQLELSYENDKVIVLTDKYAIWNPEEHDLKVSTSIYFSNKNSELIWGEKGVVPKETVLGIAIRWFSPEFKQRGVFKVDEINRFEREKNININLDFLKNTFRGRIDLSIIVYIKEIKEIKEEEKNLSNTVGFILAELKEYTLIIEGDNSDFPIRYFEEPNFPLWTVECRWEDPTIDAFIDNVEILINRAHPMYKLLNSKRKIYLYLVEEIIASAYQIIVEKLKSQEDYWKDICNGNNLEEGSVGAAIYYLLNSGGIVVDMPENFSLSLRRELDERTGIYEV